MSVHQFHVFKPWVSEWLARSIIFAILMTSLFSFSLYTSNTESAAAYYGVQSSDIQYSVVLLYASIVIFLTLDLRIIKCFRVKDYLISGLALNIVSYFVCFYSRNWHVFLFCRIIQGIVCSLLCNIVLNLTFARLHPSKAKLVGYAVFYSGLQTSGPICAIYTTHMLEIFNFNYLFAGLILSSIPVFVLVLVTFNTDGRFSRKVPLYHFDWPGFLLYCILCLSICYISVYGESLKWFSNLRLFWLCVLILVIAVLFTCRELTVKHPLIELRTLKADRFKSGLLLLTIFYIFKGAVGLTYFHIETALFVRPVDLMPLWLSNIVGICISIVLTARFLIMRKPKINIIISGFAFLAIYYLYMTAFVSSKSQVSDFLLPLFFSGLATGTIIVPLVVFTLETLPFKVAFNGSLLGIFARYLGFCASIIVNNRLVVYIRSAAQDKVGAQNLLAWSAKYYYGIMLIALLTLIFFLLIYRAISRIQN